MSEPPRSRFVEPAELEAALGRPGTLVVDLTKPATYAWGHVPGAVYLDYSDLVAARPPIGGLLPDDTRLSAALSAIGLTPETRVIAYDDEGGGKAGRLLWTLDVLGHARSLMLNGGLHAWANEGHPLETEPQYPGPSSYSARAGEACRADADYILARLGDPGLALLDTRSAEEYQGVRRFSARGGHIPGAVNMDWVRAMDRSRNLRLRPADALREELAGLGVSPDKEVIVYCQTHHRSSHTYAMLSHLGYPRVRGYAGAWSEWGNRGDTPVES